MSPAAPFVTPSGPPSRIPAESLCILVPTFHAYKWLAPFMAESLESHWPQHPPIFFCGLTPEEAGRLPHLPLSAETDRSRWCDFVLEGVKAIERLEFRRCYLLLEEHIPVARCNISFLNGELPGWMDRLRGTYASLMGWDNRRYLRRGTAVGGDYPGLLRLDATHAPRFHLHPALWQVDTLKRCLENVPADTDRSAWRFEKINDRWDAPLSEEWKRGCFQIDGSLSALPPRRGLGLAGHRTQCAAYHILMKFYPIAQKLGVGRTFWDIAGFDDFQYRGPYPMFFSGIMAKGAFNKPCMRFLERGPDTRDLAARLRAAAPGPEGMRPVVDGVAPSRHG